MSIINKLFIFFWVKYLIFIILAFVIFIDLHKKAKNIFKLLYLAPFKINKGVIFLKGCKKINFAVIHNKRFSAKFIQKKQKLKLLLLLFCLKSIFNFLYAVTVPAEVKDFL